METMITALTACLLTLVIIVSLVYVFRKWVKHEKEHDEFIQKRYKQSPAYKKTRDKFLEKVEKTKKK